MQEVPTNRRSDYLAALTQEIERKLQKALTNHSQRLQLLQQLFADIALEIDDRARDIILTKKVEGDGISKLEDIAEGGCICFYEVLADHYVKSPESARRILDLIMQLWSQSFVSHIFALLFHKWSFEVPIDESEASTRYGSALVQGASDVFWIDIQTNTRHFFSLFRYLLEEVALIPDRSKKISIQARRDLYLLLSRFILFYDLDEFETSKILPVACITREVDRFNGLDSVFLSQSDRFLELCSPNCLGEEDILQNFLMQFPTYPNSFLVGGPADYFVIELTDMLQKLKVEPVLIHYLSRMGVLQGLELRMATSTRLKACLYSFTSPGGPAYPTRAVRHAAWNTLDFLFPVLVIDLTVEVNQMVAEFVGACQEVDKSIHVGRYPRHVISLFFRLLYPWYWPSSCWNFIMTCVKTIFYYVLGLIISSWESMNRPKNA